MPGGAGRCNERLERERGGGGLREASSSGICRSGFSKLGKGIRGVQFSVVVVLEREK